MRNYLLMLALTTLCACSKPAYFKQALALYSAENYAAADKVFRLVPPADEHIQEVCFYRGVCLIELDSAAKAIPLLQKALTTSIHEKEIVLSHLGDAYNLQEEYTRAFNCFLAASLINPRLKHINTNMGITLLNAGSYRTAITYLRKDYDQAAYSPKTVVVLAEAYSRAGNADSAAFFHKLASQ